MSLALFKTGRTRTLVAKKTFNASEAAVGETPADQAFCYPQTELQWFPKAGDPTFAFNVNVVSNDSSSPSGIECIVNLSIVGVGGSTITVSGPSGPMGSWYSMAFGGTMEISLDTEEWCEVDRLSDVDPTRVDLNDGRYFPNWGGPSAYDGLNATRCTFFERAVVGSTVSLQCTFNGTVYGPYTWTVPGTGPYANFQVDYVAESNDQLGIQAFYLIKTSLSETMTSVSDFNGVPIALVGNSISQTDPGGHWSATSAVDTDGNVSLSAQAGPTSVSFKDAPANAQCNIGGAGPILNYDVQANVTAFGQTYGSANVDIWGDHLSTVMIPCAPTGTRTISQWRGAVYLLANTNTWTSPSYAEWTPVRLWLDAPSLLASGDDDSDWRMQVHGQSFKSFTLEQAASTEIAAAAMIPLVGLSLTPMETNWEGYRYLQFTADQNGSLMITTAQLLTKTFNWTVTTPGTAETITLDLCFPDAWNQDSSTLPDIDYRHSRYPLDAAGDVDETSGASSTDSRGFLNDAKGAYWGVSQVTLTLWTTSGVVMNRGHANLIADGGNVYPCAEYLPYQTYQTGGASLVQPGFVMDIGPGKRTDEYYLTHVPSTSWTDRTLSQMATQLSTFPGITATEASTFPDSYWNNNSGAASWLTLSYFDSSNVLKSNIKSLPGPSDIYANALFDQVQAYPGAGNVWNPSGGYDTSHPNVPINSAKCIRSRAAGLVLTQSGKSYNPGKTISIRTDPGGASEGSGTAAKAGYITTSPYAFGGVTSDVFPGSWGADVLQFVGTLENRWSRRVCFLGATTVGETIGLDINGALRHYRAYIDTSGSIILGAAGNSPLGDWSSRDTGLDAVDGDMRITKLGAVRPVGIIYLTSSPGDIHFVQTSDEGRTFTAAMTIASSATTCTFEETRRGLRYFYWIEESGGSYNVFGSILDATLATVRARTATNVTGIDNAKICARESIGDGGVWRIGLFYESGGAAIVKYSTDGINFS